MTSQITSLITHSSLITFCGVMLHKQKAFGKKNIFFESTSCVYSSFHYSILNVFQVRLFYTVHCAHFYIMLLVFNFYYWMSSHQEDYEMIQRVYITLKSGIYTILTISSVHEQLSLHLGWDLLIRIVGNWHCCSYKKKTEIMKGIFSKVVLTVKVCSENLLGKGTEKVNRWLSVTGLTHDDLLPSFSDHGDCKYYFTHINGAVIFFVPFFYCIFYSCIHPRHFFLT